MLIFIEFTWWQIYMAAWAMAAPGICVALSILWGAPRWWNIPHHRWLWNITTLVIVTIAPVGVLFLTLAVGPSGFAGRTHAYSTLELLTYHWLPGLISLPALVLAGLWGWKRFGGSAEKADNHPGDSS